MLKQILILMFPLALFVSHVDCLENSACIGNIQDSPVTNFKNTSLKGWSAFAIVPVYSLQGSLQKKVSLLAKKEFGKVGKITEMKVPDVTGLGMAANVLSLEVQKVKTWDDKSVHLLRISLSLQTTAKINRTAQECSAYIWTSSVFVESDSAELNEKNLLSGVETLFKQFAACYLASNSEDTPKPVFYLYES